MAADPIFQTTADSRVFWLSGWRHGTLTGIRLILTIVLLGTNVHQAFAETVIWKCVEVFTSSGRQKPMQLEIDLERRTVRIDTTAYNTIWADGDKLHGEFKAWVHVEGPS